MAPDRGHRDVELFAAQSFEGVAQVLTSDDETDHTFVHVDHN